MPRRSSTRERLASETGLVFVHPFDDPLVIAGQGTVAVELLRQSPGGSVCGVRSGRRRRADRRHRPRTSRRCGPTSTSSASSRSRPTRWRSSIEAGRRVRLDDVGIFVDGVAVQQVGAHTFPIAQATVTEVLRVSNDEMCAAIKDIFDDTRTIVEPAGALALAGLKSYVDRARRERTAAGRRAERREHELRPAALRRGARGARRRPRSAACGDDSGAARRVPRLLRRAGRVRRHRVQLPAQRTGPGGDLRRHRDRDAARRRASSPARLRALGYETADLSGNEMAKLHVRHMVGGRTPHVGAERVCRFEFPNARAR